MSRFRRRVGGRSKRSLYARLARAPFDRCPRRRRHRVSARSGQTTLPELDTGELGSPRPSRARDGNEGRQFRRADRTFAAVRCRAAARCGLEARAVSTDESPVFQYALKLRYPNGRIFDYQRESEHRLGVGNEFDAFGRTWRIACDVPLSRLNPVHPTKPKAFLCHPIGESGLEATQGR